MERPILIYFLLPFSILSIILYIRIIILAWRKSSSLCFNSFFFRQTRTQGLLDITYVIVYFLTELPQDQKNLWFLLTGLNGTIVPQLIYCHTYLCILGQSYGIALIALNRMLLVCAPTSAITMKMDSIPFPKVLALHMTIPLAFALYMLIGQPASSFLDVGPPAGITRVTATWCVKLNSDIAAAICLVCAVFCAFCYFLSIFVALHKRPMYSRRKDLPLLITSFFIFLALCLVSLFTFSNRFFVNTDIATHYFIRKHYFLFSFPVSLINPLCLLLTSAKIRGLVIGERLRQRFGPLLGRIIYSSRADIARSSVHSIVAR